MFPLASDRSRLRYSLFTAKVKADSNATSYERLLAEIILFRLLVTHLDLIDEIADSNLQEGLIYF